MDKGGAVGDGLRVQAFVVNDFQENSYVLYDEEGRGVVIDCGFHYDEDWAAVTDFLTSSGVRVELLLNTHGHIDHVFGVERGRREWGVPFALHGGDTDLLTAVRAYGVAWGFEVEPVSAPERVLNGGDEVCVGGMRLHVLHTPGHTPGGCCFYLKEAGLLFSGDTLFSGSVGRSDLPGGDHGALFESIERELLTLPDETIVLPGHGPSTTIGAERVQNPFLRRFR